MKTSTVEKLESHHAAYKRKFSAPLLKPITPDEAKKILMRYGDSNDPEIQFMLDCVEKLRDPVGS